MIGGALRLTVIERGEKDHLISLDTVQLLGVARQVRFTGANELHMARVGALTFDMSVSRRQAKPAVGCPLDGGVKRQCAPLQRVLW